MTDTHCRIGRVTHKDSGLVVMTPRPRALSDAHVAEMHQHMDSIVAGFNGNLGYLLVVGVGMDMSFSRASRRHVDLPMGVTSIPSFVADILRRDMIDDVLDDRVVGT